jgi:hypothetical protein
VFDHRWNIFNHRGTKPEAMNVEYDDLYTMCRPHKNKEKGKFRANPYNLPKILSISGRDERI